MEFCLFVYTGLQARGRLILIEGIHTCLILGFLGNVRIVFSAWLTKPVPGLSLLHVQVVPWCSSRSSLYYYHRMIRLAC